MRDLTQRSQGELDRPISCALPLTSLIVRTEAKARVAKALDHLDVGEKSVSEAIAEAEEEVSHCTRFVLPHTTPPRRI